MVPKAGLELVVILGKSINYKATDKKRKDCFGRILFSNT